MDFQEAIIIRYSGLSSETKPTAANGTTVYNGSRFREVDTGDEYFYNLSNDTWYLYGQGLKQIAGASPVVDTKSINVLEQILDELKKIEYHLAVASDTNLK